jgi:hypothetical protein
MIADGLSVMLVPVESLVCEHENWYDLQLNKLTLCRIRSWEGIDWKVYSSDSECREISWNNSFQTPKDAAIWYVKNVIGEKAK